MSKQIVISGNEAYYIIIKEVKKGEAYIIKPFQQPLSLYNIIYLHLRERDDEHAFLP
jgi:hypothetical protein